METPICDFIREYQYENKLRLHMPGHKGQAHLGFEAFDITEIPGADVLYDSKGIIKQSEKNASMLFGTCKTVYSTEGSSLAIRAMLYLIKVYGQTKFDGDGNERKVTVLAGRNAHKTFVTASAILGIDVKWLMPNAGGTAQGESQDSLISCNITPEFLETYLCNLQQDFSKNQMPIALYVTSPDYLGNVLDISGLARVCRKYDLPLLVDNAHGAYLNFLPQSQHPIALGADMCCDSAHKTLPALTGAAYLHISENAPGIFKDSAEQAMSIFASTSPSYLILQSMDYVNKCLSSGYAEKIFELAKRIENIKMRLCEHGFSLVGDEPLKITIATKSYGYTGCEFAELMNGKGIVCEFSDPDYVVFMFTPEITFDDLDMFAERIFEISKREPLQLIQPKLPIPHRALSLRDALFCPSKTVPLSDALGKTLAAVSVSCPPAIPILMCGEIVDNDAVACFEYYGITEIKVII